MATLFAGLFLFEAAGRKHKEWEKRQTHTTKKVDIFYYGDGGSIVLSWDLAYLIVIGINNVMSTLQIYIYIYIIQTNKTSTAPGTCFFDS